MEIDTKDRQVFPFHICDGQVSADPRRPSVLPGSSKRRLTSLYSEQDSTRRGSVGGMSTLAIETELGKLQMLPGNAGDADS